MKCLIVFFWSGLVLAGQCAPSDKCAPSQIALRDHCPKFVCDGGNVYRCKETINRDKTRTCSKASLAKHAPCNCLLND